MKQILVLLIIVCCCSCGQNTDKASVKVLDTTTASIPTTKDAKQGDGEVKGDILKAIKAHYYAEYGKEFQLKEEYDGEDSLLHITYSAVSADLTDTESMATIRIPCFAQQGGVLHGDMNADGKDDVLISVVFIGGHDGGNTYWSDHFLFLGEGSGKYKLACVAADADILDAGDYFKPEQIDSGYIKGKAVGYDEDDARCCPSLNYVTKVKLANGKLVNAGMQFINKTEGAIW